MLQIVLVKAGLFHVFGEGVAKLPIVATNETNQGKCFEKLLAYLKVKKMVVPAAEDQSEYIQTLTSIATFQGTCLLEKEVLGPQGGVIFQDGFCFSLSYAEVN
uniref:Increased DNA methylation 1 C-terminal domain-containing protein n=1 Tax=Lactuca sativa TaxID=4236 RepID=A0A9R1V4K7_LACSA|nr:hypothetical protein LSAT_V11C700363480 [Lactuca sativa]